MKKTNEVRLTLTAWISAIEIDLRSVLQSNIVAYMSDLSFFRDPELEKKILTRFKKDNPSLEINENLSTAVEYLDFGDTFTIILKHKELLNSEYFQNLKQLSKKLNEIIPIRNRVMHSRPLLGGDYSTVLAFISEIAIGNSLHWNNTIEIKAKIEDDPNYVFKAISTNTFTSSDTVYHNLPLPDFDETGFIGRQQDIDSIKNLILGNSRVISLIGDGGIGKTALILKVAYDLIDMKELCPFDAVIWTSAKATMLTAQGIQEIRDSLKDLSGLISDITDAIDLSIDTSNHNFQEILEYMSSFNVLLIIDNLETIHSEEVRDFIREAQLKCKIVITSRIGLGELEFRRVIKGLTESESAQLIRSFSKMRNNDILLKANQSELSIISKKLYYNPLAIKWFVSSVEMGMTPNEVLINKENLLNFCLTNVYDKISYDAKKIIRTILASRKKLSDAELIFLTKLEVLRFRNCIIELCKTTLIGREVNKNKEYQDILYFIPDFAKDFLSKIENRNIDRFFIKSINDNLRELTQRMADINRTSILNEFSINSISYRNTDEQVVAKILSEALALSKKKDYNGAKIKIEEAKKVTPQYFEVYRVSAFISVASDDYLQAEKDYQIGVDIEPNNPRLLYYYSQFLLFNLGDFKEAIVLAEKLVKIRPNNPYTELLLARCYSQNAEYSKTVEILEKIIADTELDNTKEKIICYTDLISCYANWGIEEYKINRNLPAAVAKFHLGISIFENAINKRLSDSKTIKSVCQLIVQFISHIPISFQSEIEELINIIKKYNEIFRTSTLYPTIILRLNQNYQINLGYNYDKTNTLMGIFEKCFPDRQFCFIKGELNRYFAHKNNFESVDDWNNRGNNVACTFIPSKNEKGPNALRIKLFSTKKT